jgi:hypothetical protein
MKKWFFAVSLIFIVAGLAVVASGYYPVSREDMFTLGSVHNVPLTNSTDGEYYVIEGTTIGMFIPTNATQSQIRFNPDQWTVRVNLTQGDLVDFWITQGLDWPYGIFEVDEYIPGGYGALYVGANVTDPRGGFTMFTIVLGKPTDTSSSSTSSLLTVFYINITQSSYNQGGLDVSPFYVNTTEKSFYTNVAGIAQFNGTYTVRVLQPQPARKYPVTSIEVVKHVSRTEYTTTYTLPAGIGLSSAGLALSYLSFRKKPRLTHINKAYANVKKLH